MTSNSIDEGFVLSFRQLSNTRKNIDEEEDIRYFYEEIKNRNTAIEKRCINLANEDFSILMDIVDAYCTAIKNARSGK